MVFGNNVVLKLLSFGPRGLWRQVGIAVDLWNRLLARGGTPVIPAQGSVRRFRPILAPLAKYDCRGDW